MSVKGATFRIRHWHDNHENAASRKLASLNWVAVPTATDSKAFRYLAARDDAPQIFGVYSLLVLIAARAPKPYRGALVDEDGILTAADIAVRTGFDVGVVTNALEVLSDPKHKICWLEPWELEASPPEAGAWEAPRSGRGPDVVGQPPDLLARSTEGVARGPAPAPAHPQHKQTNKQTPVHTPGQTNPGPTRPEPDKPNIQTGTGAPGTDRPEPGTDQPEPGTDRPEPEPTDPGGGEPGPGRGRRNGQREVFCQTFLLGVCQAAQLEGDRAVAQRDSIMAVADRIADRGDRDTVGRELIDLAASKMAAQPRLRRPMAAWQKETNRLYPPNGKGT